jgi:hypothetical protein
MLHCIKNLCENVIEIRSDTKDKTLVWEDLKNVALQDVESSIVKSIASHVLINEEKKGLFELS